MNNNDKSEQKDFDTTEEQTTNKTLSDSFNRTNSETTENDSSMQALIDQEQAQAREHMREELGREPTQEEIDRWLSAHTEGH